MLVLCRGVFNDNWKTIWSLCGTCKVHPQERQETTEAEDSVAAVRVALLGCGSSSAH